MIGEPLSALAEAVIQGNTKRAERLTKRYLNYGMDPLTIIEEGLARGIRIVGEKFEAGEFFLPDLVLGTEAMRAGIRILDPELQKSPLKTKMKTLGRVVLGTAAGDIHDIGKQIIIAMLAAAGFEIHDVGVNVSIERFVEAIKRLEPDVVGISVLLRSALPAQKQLIDALRQEGLREQVKVLIVGAPVTATWAKEIGTDAYANNVVSAVSEVKRLVAQIHNREGD